MYLNLAILAIFTYFYCITSGGFVRTWVNGALVFAAFGLIMSPLCLGLLNLDVDEEDLRTLAELTLALVLYTDAANANLRELEHSYRIPRNLLLLGLPLTIVLGFGLGLLIFDSLGWLEIAILATMLAPTDAALGKTVVTDERVPVSIREGLNMESGLNDGICVPILFVFLALASETGAGGGSTTMLALRLVAEEVGIGLAVGIGMTYIAVYFARRFLELGWVTQSWEQVIVPSLAVACFTLAQALGGSGFIACFAGGILFGFMVDKQKHEVLLRGEAVGDTLALITWVVFGAAVIGDGLGAWNWDALLYAVLSLTVVRMLPVFLVLAGLQLRTDEKLFVGWFGPRGLATIVFAVIVLNENLPGGELVITTVVYTIVLSVIFHGISANPLVAGLASRLREAGRISAAGPITKK